MPPETATDEHPRLRPVLRIAGAVLAIVLLLPFVLHFLLPAAFFGLHPTRVAVRNQSAGTVSSLELTLKYVTGGSTTRRIDALAPGRELAVEPDKLDIWVTLSFALDGAIYTHEATVDLWTGETYAFEIQPDGSISSGHDHPAPPH